MRVLLTGVGGPAGSSLARQLTGLGHWVAGLDAQAVDNPLLAKFQTVPPAAAPGYVCVLARIADAWQVDAIIPSVSEELVTVARSAGDLGAVVLIGTPEAVATADDKYLTAVVLRDSGVSVPAFAAAEEFPDAATARAAFGGAAIIVKPRVSRGGRGVRLLCPDCDATDFAWPSPDQRAIVQEFAPGNEYAPVLFRSGGASGSDVCVVLRKTALKDGVVGNALSVQRVNAATDNAAPAVADVACRASAALGLGGPIDMDIRLDVDARPVVLEVNARFGANSEAAPELLSAALDELQLLVAERRRARGGDAVMRR